MKTMELAKIINDAINETKNKYQYINILVNNIDDDIKDNLLRSIIKSKSIIELDDLKMYVDDYMRKNKEKELQKINNEIQKLQELKSKLV